ncbi:uncharacterized protein TNCV_2817991 [Trichonephila clavipes]|nr:uncharacterized protein TNCV_2817991 [Trichonephila clavipes]
MFDSSSYDNPTPLAHADTSRDVLPRGVDRRLSERLLPGASNIRTQFFLVNSIERSKGPPNSDAFSALETAVEWYEQQSECFPIQLLLLKRIRDLAAKKRRYTMLQRKIGDYFPQ